MLGRRPRPGSSELLPLVRGTTRDDGSLVVEFDDGAAETLAAFVEAERLCCTGIGWDIERETGLRLRITANDAQLQALEGLWLSSQQPRK